MIGFQYFGDSRIGECFRRLVSGGRIPTESLWALHQKNPPSPSRNQISEIETTGFAIEIHKIIAETVSRSRISDYKFKQSYSLIQSKFSKFNSSDTSLINKLINIEGMDVWLLSIKKSFGIILGCEYGFSVLLKNISMH